jgi:hypothetical protein
LEVFMPNAIAPKTLTVRLTPELYSAAQRAAKQRAVSLNTLLQESLAAALRSAEEQQRYDDYTLLGQDAEMCDVEYAAHAQAEVMLHAEHA